MPRGADARPRVIPQGAGALVGDFDVGPDVAEFLITGIEVEARGRIRSSARPCASTSSGAAKGGGRAERLGHWQMRWRRGADGAGASSSGPPLDHLRSRAPRPGLHRSDRGGLRRATPSFRRQLVPGLDDWASRPRRRLHARRHGTPRRVGGRRRRRRSRRPLRLAARRACPTGSSATSGDGTFEDVTEAAGRRRPRPHVAVALRRRGQRRRPGPHPAHAHRAAAVPSTTARAASPAMPTRSGSRSRCRGR